MLEYLNFEIGGYWGGYTEAQVSVREGCVYCVYRIGCDAREESKTLSASESAKWLEKLENIHINRWRSQYQPEDVVCDGTHWGLEYKVSGKRCRHISGDNEYPDNFDELLKLIKKLVPTAVNKE